MRTAIRLLLLMLAVATISANIHLNAVWAQDHRSAKAAPDSKAKDPVSTEDDLQARPLGRSDMVVTKLDSGPKLSPFRCDAEGNLYFRRFVINARGKSGPTLKLSPQGEQLMSFDISAAQLPNAFPYTITVSPGGEVAQLAGNSQMDVYIVRFRKDGTVSGTTKLESQFMPGPFVVFPSGEALVTGAQNAGVDGSSRAAFTGLFDKDGKLIKKLTFEEDKAFQEATAQAAAATGTPPRVGAITTGEAVIGSDGNAYVLRKSKQAEIFVISPSGQHLRTIKVDSGQLISGEQLPPVGGVHEHDGRLAVMFKNYGIGPGRIKVLDSGTGSLIATYDLGSELGAGLTCFDQSKFTFLGVRDDKIVLNIAQPQ